MHAFAAPVVLLCWAALCAGEGKGEGEGGSLLVTKCCDQFTYLDLAKKVCLESPESQEDAATLFGPPLWAPEWLRGEPDLQVKYYGIPWHERELPAAWLDAEEPLGRRLLAVDADARRFVLEPFGGAVDARSVAYQLVCFDATRDPRRPFVAATWLLGVALRKCCAKGALLDRGLQCSPPSEPSADPEWPVDFHQPLSALAWAPAPLRRAVPTADVYYDVKRELPGVEGAVVDADDPDAWELLFPRRSDDWLQAVRVRAGDGPAGASNAYCFDATEAGSGLPARVLLARVALVSKCCPRGQQLGAREMQCVARPGMQTDARLAEQLAPGDPSAYWLPPALAAGNRSLAVRYRVDWGEWYARLIFPAESARIVGFPDRPAAACVRLRQASGREHVACTSDFCFDALAGGGPAPRVLAVDRFERASVITVTKCCHQGQMLHEDPDSLIRCQQDPWGDWTPENSSLADELYAERIYMAQPLIECLDQAFTLVEERPARELDKLLGWAYEGRFRVRFYCKDLLRRRDGAPPQDALAFCELPSDSDLFEQVRPLHVVAAALLAVAVVAVVTQRPLRSTTHGRALACHAACLMASNALQAAWFFTHVRRKGCDGFGEINSYLFAAYAIYYFLMAGAFWLNVISVNMARGFRRPQGAVAREGGGGWRRRWRRRLVLLYAWGLPAVLTAVCITAHQYEREAQRRGYATPTFFETRTCFVEYHRQSRDLHGNNVEEERKLGTVYYYYLPCGALVAVNAVCLVMTLCRIRELRRDALCLKREPGLLQSALLYVKLLLTAGVLELGLEATVWAFRPHLAHSKQNFYHAQHVSYVFSAIGSFLDVARAGAVLWLAVGRERARVAWRSLRDRFTLRLCPNASSNIEVTRRSTPTTTTTTNSVSTSSETERL
ncbi:Probable G-protein coupled receptor Mth-like 4 [Gryllus bimaculatus]|nr:Probable G-protein coupled receptor Mth-like 4 [Gryllus bimaculatus]